MGKFTNLEQDVFSVFNSNAWKAEGITTVPINFQASAIAGEFIRVAILPSSVGLNLRSTSGVCLIDIFIPAGAGPRRASTIADKLDEYLCGKSLNTGSGVTQFSKSALSHKGIDRDNLTLYHSSYTVLFNHFGVS